MEARAAGGSAVHRLHPMCKLLAAVAYIITLASFERHDLGGLLPMAAYPLLLCAASGIGLGGLLKRASAALPFCLFIGVSALALERGAAFGAGGFAVSFGALSFAVVILRAYLCVCAVLLLAATTPITDITAQLRLLRVPPVFVILFEMTYRYIGVLFIEAHAVGVAYRLRGPRARGVDVRHAGSFAGCLLLKSFDRAERVYAAMKCRGFGGPPPTAAKRPWRGRDGLYLAAVCGLCLAARLIAG